jgi:drug/metabolite transporter (DMT)-like permease
VQSHTGTHLALLATAMMWGLNVTAVKILTQSVDVTLVASVRTVLAALALSVLLPFGSTSRPRWTLRLALLGAVGALLMVYANQTLFAAAMLRTSATNGALIMALAPIVSTCLESMLFRKQVGSRQLAGIAIALAGVAVVVLKGRDASWTAVSLGDVLMLCAVCAFAAGGATVQRLSSCASPMIITWFVHVAGAALLVLHALATTPNAMASVQALSAWQWTLMLYSGVLATALGAVAWGRGIAALGVGRTANYLSWVPIFGVGFGALLLGEPLNWWHGMGLGAVLIGSVLAAKAAGPQAGSTLNVCT